MTERSPATELEEQRVATLDSLDVMDTAPEPAFDDVVRVARALLGTPIALVSLLDRDRQWFKAREGLPLCETPIEQAVCAYAVAQRDVLVIPDLTRDPRTRDNPLVTAPGGLRFYAGAPLLMDDGAPIGTVCAIDLVARPEGITADQRAGLEALARQTVALLELRQFAAGQREQLRAFRASDASADGRLHELERIAETMARAQRRASAAEQAARLGTFTLDVRTDLAEVSPQFCRLFGLPERPSYPFAFLESFIIPDRDSTHSTLDTRHAGTAEEDAAYRIRRADTGEVRWLDRRAAFERGADGAVLRMHGTVQDNTERRNDGRRMEALLRLGDQLRDLDDVGAIIAAASETLCDVLLASRAGYAALDLRTGSMTVAQDCVRGVPSIAGEHPISMFSATVADLCRGEVRVDPDVTADPALAADGPGYRAIDARAQIKVPLLDHGELVGVLFVHDSQPRRWSEAEIEFAASVADRAYAAIAKAKAEAERRLLNHELAHRLKNMLAMVQAIARQTLKTVSEREPVAAFERRLLALASAHDVLLQDSWTAARIEPLVQGLVAQLGQEGRVRASGPNVLIGARPTLGLSLLLHELSTNALKHGALSAEGGQVELSWHVEEGAEPTFVLEWRETGGPPAATPTRLGFGSRLIGMGLLGTGGSDVRYASAGLVARFTAPLGRMRAE